MPPKAYVAYRLIAILVKLLAQATALRSFKNAVAHLIQAIGDPQLKLKAIIYLLVASSPHLKMADTPIKAVIMPRFIYHKTNKASGYGTNG